MTTIARKFMPRAVLKYVARAVIYGYALSLMIHVAAQYSA